MTGTIALYRAELRIALRNGEQLLVALFIPLGVLLFFSNVSLFERDLADPVQVVAPACLALAVMSGSMVSLGIATGFERYYGVLKRLGATPLSRRGWLVAKVGVVATIGAVQWAVLVPVALALGWSPGSGWPAGLVAAAFGTFAFAGLGLLLAGTLPGLANLAVCNGLYLVLVMTGNMVVGVDRLPGPVEAVSRALPAAPLSDLLIASLHPDRVAHASSWPVLAAWAVALPLAAARWFRWS